MVTSETTQKPTFLVSGCRTHQTGDASAGFDRLFARLSDQPNVWIAVNVRSGRQPTRASPDDYLASHGPPTADSSWRTVSIPIRVVKGKIEGFGRGVPALADCVGDLIVPALAVSNAADLEWLTQTGVAMLFEAGMSLLLRLNGRPNPART